MFAEEWSLILFTLLTQLAVGVFILLTAVRVSLVKENENQLAAKLTDKGFLAAGILMALAMVISLFHLGTPGGAYRAIFNLGSSWLSREIFFAGLFFALTVACYYLARKDRFHAFLAWISSLVGLLVIFNMASIYTSTIRPAWTDINTVLAFLGTTFFFGAVGSVAFMALGAKGENLPPMALNLLRKVSVVGFIALAVQFIYLPVYYAALSTAGPAGIASAQIIAGSYAPAMVFRWIFSLAGGGFLAYALFKQGDAPQLPPASWVYSALILALVGEFLGRYLFYASGVSIVIG